MNPPTQPSDLASGPLDDSLCAAMDAVPSALAVVDPAGKLAFLNVAAEKLFGCGRGEWLGQPVETMIPEGLRPEHAGRVAAYCASPVSRPMGAGRDLTARRSDGREFPVEVGLGPFPTRHGTWVVAAILDLTERQRLAQAARVEHERLRSYWEAASEGLITVDEAGVIETVNRATERIFGYGRAELVGQPMEMLLPEGRRPGHTAKRLAFFADPRLRPMGAGLNLTGRRKDGSEFPLEIGLSFSRVEGRTVAIGFVTDISEKRRLEEQSAVLGTLVDLQQQMSRARKEDSSAEDADPVTDLNGRARCEKALEESASRPLGLFLQVYCVQHVERMQARFGSRMADRILFFAGQLIADSLRQSGDRLFRWAPTTFVALVRRPPDVAAREVRELCSKRVEYFVEHAGGNALVLISLQGRSLARTQDPVAEVIARVDRAARSGCRG